MPMLLLLSALSWITVTVAASQNGLSIVDSDSGNVEATRLRTPLSQQRRREVLANSNDFFFNFMPVETCARFGGPCAHSNNCCNDGSCDENNRCFCESPGGACSNLGGWDTGCCSRSCGTDGRCTCVPLGYECLAADQFLDSFEAFPHTDACCRGAKCSAEEGICVPDLTDAPSAAPTNEPTESPSSAPTLGECDVDEYRLGIEISTDQYGGDTSWDVVHEFWGSVILAVPGGTYGDHDIDLVETCVGNGTYIFTVHDSWGDGFAGDGHFKVFVDYEEIIYTVFFQKNATHVLNIGHDPTPDMSEREKQYLDEHNIRRKDWHEVQNGVAYVPLKYSLGLAEESRIWAEKLLDDCDIVGIEHEPGVKEGENLAKNHGQGGWGQLYPVHNIVNRWVEFEIDDPYPANAHLTQALWRASKYMGCGESAKDWRGGKCRVQVCRYARAGNCEMDKYNSRVGENWLPPMLKGSSRCGPTCPPEGCY